MELLIIKFYQNINQISSHNSIKYTGHYTSNNALRWMVRGLLYKQLTYEVAKQNR
jgi:hypothetical protein